MVTGPCSLFKFLDLPLCTNSCTQYISGHSSVLELLRLESLLESVCILPTIMVWAASHSGGISFKKVGGGGGPDHLREQFVLQIS